MVLTVQQYYHRKKHVCIWTCKHIVHSTTAATAWLGNLAAAAARINIAHH